MNGETPLVAAVVPVFNRLETTRRFVLSFRGLRYPRKLLIICDDGSTDGTGEFLRAQPDVITVTGDGSLWWSGATNAAIREALRHSPDFVLTINDDSQPSPDYLDILITAALRHRGCIMASSLVQMQDPERHWSLGATFLKHGHVFYVNDCFGARVSHTSAFVKSPCLLDTMPGNGVLYPVVVFQSAGLFDEKWTPQYHGDTLMIHRAARVGIEARMCLEAVLMNDMGHHRDAKRFDPMLSLKSAHYAPAIYKSVEERENAAAALEFLWGISGAFGGEFSPMANESWHREVRLLESRTDFVFDPHLACSAPGGAFAFLGYHVSPGLKIVRRDVEMHFEYEVEGCGILSLVLQVRRKCRVYCFVITSQDPAHIAALCEVQASEHGMLDDESVVWFQVELEPGERQLPLALEMGSAAWRGLFLVLDENARIPSRAAACI